MAGLSIQQIQDAEKNVEDFHKNPPTYTSSVPYDKINSQLDGLQKQITPGYTKAVGNLNLITAYQNGSLKQPQIGGAPAPSSNPPPGTSEPMVKIKDNQTGQIMLVPQSQLGTYGLSADGSSAPAASPSFAGGQPAISNSNTASQIPGGFNPQGQDEATVQQNTLDKIRTLPAVQGQALADEFKAAYGYEPGSQKPLTQQQQQVQDLSQQHVQTKNSLQDLLKSYLSIPSDQKGRANLKTMAHGLPFGEGIEGFTAPDALNYDKQVRALAATVSPLSGGGEGTGLRINNAELAGWTNLLPKTGVAASVNQNNVKLLDEQMRGKYGQDKGLDDAILKQYGITRTDDGTYHLQDANKIQPPNVSERLAAGAVNDVTSIPGNLWKQGQDIAQSEQQNHLGMDANIAMSLGKGILNTAQAYNPVSFKDGKVAFDFAKPMNQAIDHPVNTALLAAPFVKGVGAGAVADEGAAGEAGAAMRPPTSGNPITNLGANISHGVRQIDLPPAINAAAREADVNNTLDTLGIKGSPAQQYAQLQPKMAELSNNIDSYLAENSKDIPMTEVKNSFMDNLKDQLRTKSLTSATASNEINGYLNDLGKLGAHEKPPVGQVSQTLSKADTVNTKDLFALKKDVNQDYQGVAKKIQNGSPLNDREKVIAAARKTLDDVIAKAHPEVKQATIQQSHLYDAVDSLHAARQGTNGSSFTAFGTKIPIPGELLKKGIDAAGRGIQKVGGGTKRGTGALFKGGKQAVQSPAVVNAPLSANEQPVGSGYNPTFPNYASAQMKTAGGNGTKLTRDMRFKQGNPMFKQ